MGVLRRSDEPGSLSDRDISQAQFRDQIGIVVDLMRQIAGDAAVQSGEKQPCQPLSTPFVLYVDPLLGSDRYVSGCFNSCSSGISDEDLFRSTLNHLSAQRLLCGYSAQRPFRSLNRAVLEAVLLLCRPCYEREGVHWGQRQVVIRLAAGLHELWNGPALSATAAAPRVWSDGHEPSREEWLAFNGSHGGVILPAGVQLQGAGRDATVLVPTYVPVAAAETEALGRSALLAITGQSAISELSFADARDCSSSHHLLDAVQTVAPEDLERFYQAVRTVAEQRQPSAALCQPKFDELHYGPASTDTTAATVDGATGWASVRRCRLLSSYGMAGIHADGRRMGGLQRLEVQELLASSNQRDLEAWRWRQPLSGELESVDAVRFRNASAAQLEPAAGWEHCGLRASHGAQLRASGLELEGFSCHGWADEGGLIEAEGAVRYGVWGLKASGHRNRAHSQDEGWQLQGVRCAEALHEANTTLQWLRLGRLALLEEDAVHLQRPLPGDRGGPQLLTEQGYSLVAGSLLWVRDSAGRCWSAPLAPEAWSPEEPQRLALAAPLGDEQGVLQRWRELAGELVGAEVLVRRLLDQRSPQQRATALLLSHHQPGRLPELGQVLQLDGLEPCWPLAACFRPQLQQAGMVRAAAVALGGVAAALRLDGDWDPNPHSRDAGWSASGEHSWAALQAEQPDAAAAATLLQALGGVWAQQLDELLMAKDWWQQEQLLAVADQPQAAAVLDGSRIEAEGLRLRQVGYGNRAKGELPWQQGMEETINHHRAVLCSDGGRVIV